MVTIAGETVALAELLINITVTVVGAACGKLTGNATDWPIPAIKLEGTFSEPWVATFTEAVVSARFAELA